MARQKGSRTGRCRGCNHLERVRIERLLSAGASVKGTARKFELDYHALRRHWINPGSAEARAAYIAGAGVIKDQLEEIVADESLALIDHYRIIRSALYKGFSAASELGDGNSLALLAGRLHENLRDCGRLTGAATRPAAECSEQRFGQSRLHESDRARSQVCGRLFLPRRKLLFRSGLRLQPGPGRCSASLQVSAASSRAGRHPAACA